ncbi:MAG: HDOD domain-containing protein [Candidatus Sumerlaeota bacterium]|nr:HDOD domain-containing protein [Candidatus Sumerlaeota bacterium]
MSKSEIISSVNVDDIPPMPQSATHAMRLLGDPSSDAIMIAKVIMEDQAMTARLLQVANSPFYGRSKSVNTVRDAIVVIGYPGVKGLIISSSTRGIVKNPGLLETLLWEHSLGAAFAAREIARETGLVNPDEAFTAGLIHDIGRIVMSSIDRDRYVRVMKECYNEIGGPDFSLTIENEIFGYAHTDLGAMIAQKWRLSDDLRIALQFHHIADTSLPEGAPAEYGAPMATLTCLANLFQYRLGIGTRAPIEFNVSAHIAAQRLHLDARRISLLLLAVKKAFEEHKDSFAFA